MSGDIQFWVTIGGAILLGWMLISFLIALRGRNKTRKLMKMYAVNDSVLSKSEGRFYASLAKVVGEKYLILMKVRLTDIFGIENGSGYQVALNKISQNHVDFLLCEPDNFEPVLAIELDDSNRRGKVQKARDEFVNSIYTQTGLNLLRVPDATQYPAEELRDKIGGILREAGRL